MRMASAKGPVLLFAQANVLVHPGAVAGRCCGAGGVVVLSDTVQPYESI